MRMKQEILKLDRLLKQGLVRLDHVFLRVLTDIQDLYELNFDSVSICLANE